MASDPKDLQRIADLEAEVKRLHEACGRILNEKMEQVSDAARARAEKRQMDRVRLGQVKAYQEALQKQDGLLVDLFEEFAWFVHEHTGAPLEEAREYVRRRLGV